MYTFILISYCYFFNVIWLVVFMLSNRNNTKSHWKHIISHKNISLTWIQEKGRLNVFFIIPLSYPFYCKMKKFGEYVIISQRLRKSNTLIYKGLLLSIFLVFIERVLTLQYYQSCVDSLYILALLNPDLYSGICLKLNNRVSNTKRCISIYFVFILSSPDSKSHVKYCYRMTYVVAVRKHLHLNPLWNHWTNRNQNCYECSLDDPQGCFWFLYVEPGNFIILWWSVYFSTNLD